MEHDFLSFRLLAESCQRLDAINKMEQVCVLSMGSNGMSKESKKLWNQWTAAADLGGTGGPSTNTPELNDLIKMGGV